MNMQVLVMYYSRTGNTKQLAEQIARGVQEVPGVTCLLKPCAAVTQADFLDSDAIIAGSPVYFGSMAAELKSVFDSHNGIRKQMENKIGAAFATSHHSSGGKETTLISIIQAMLIFGMVVVGDPMSAGGHYGVAYAQGQEAAFADDARKLGGRVAGLVTRLAAVTARTGDTA
jgi:NAD(P)H dehydrogenase (quinone)